MPTAAIIGLGAATIGGALIGKSSTDKATKAQVKAGDKASGQIAASTAQARGDLFKLSPAAQQNAQRGYQGALDVFSQSLPQQAGQFQAGNVAAQNQLLAGMPQFQNAILGAPVDYSQFQATQLEQPNFDFANQQLQYTDPYAPPPTPQGTFGADNAIGPYPTGGDPRYNIGQPTNRAFNYNDILTRGFR
jgi:hypothetical protein